MKRLLFILGLVAVVGLTSCEKCADCACTRTLTFDFDDEIDDDIQAGIESTYETSTALNYPETSKEICEKNKDLDDAIEEYENDSDGFTEEQNISGAPYTVDLVYTCSCTKQ